MWRANGSRRDTGHAVVLGGSLAGLFAAAALARHLERVTVVERDALPGPQQPQWRRGVPQARHAHNLMMAGHLAMERLFPGIRGELDSAGMVTVRMPADMLLLTAGGWMPRFDTDLQMLTSSREVIDSVVLRRLRANDRVTFLTQTEALGLLPGTDGSVQGVKLRHRDKNRDNGWDEPYDLAADFVVDASGRSSRSPQWLKALGYEAPAEAVVDAQTAYSTCVFDPPAGHQADWNCILLQYSPDAPRQGILNPIENNRWMVSLAGLGGVRPPDDIDGFLEYAKNLRSPVLYEVLRDATPVTQIHRSGRTENRRRHYHKLRRWPDRFMVMGDAVGCFNPSYGQGMSVAAGSALALDDALEARATTAGIASGLRGKVAKCIDLAWMIAATADLKYPWASQKVDLQTKISLSYLYRVIGACPTSLAASQALLDINQMVATTNAVFRPAVIGAVLRGPRLAAACAEPPAPQTGAGKATVRR